MQSSAMFMRSMDPPTAFKRVRPAITEPVCKKIKLEQSENQPQYLCPQSSHDPNINEVLKIFKSNLREKFKCLYPGISKKRKLTLLNKIYTELNITESKSGEICNEHEVRQIETQSRTTTTDETQIKCNDIFKPEQDKHIRSVLTKGVAGIGKTVSVQKFILDWAEEKENQDVHLIFPLPFREINLIKEKTLSLLDLLHLFFPETKEMEIFSDKYKMLFIFDGLDECRLSLDFHSSVRLCDVNESTSVDVMLTNLIKGNLCPSSLIWITSRPAAADLIPSECVDRVTEVRGFSDPQKEEYFRKRISDESLSDQIISHLKSSRSLYIMCHIPVFCWISVTVLERILSKSKKSEMPKTLTQMYTHFLIIQTKIQHQKDHKKKVKDEYLIFKLCELSYEHLVKGNLIFNDEDLRECGIDVAEASLDSVLHTQIFREEFGLCQRKVYSFVHLSIQEHLAALYVHLTFINNNINVFEQIKQYQTAKHSIHDLYRTAIDKAVQSKNGHLDLFLRFLLGLSLESNQNLIQCLRIQTGKTSHSSAKIVRYIKQKTTSTQSPEKCISLFHCLNELGDRSLVDEIQQYLKSALGKATLSSSQWIALVLVMLTSEQFNMNQFFEENKAKPLKVLQKLLPVICESRTVQLNSCNITDEGCVALRSNPSHLTHLNLSDNNLGDSEVNPRSAELENSDCKLEILSHDPNINEVLNTFKSNLKEKFQCLYPGTSKQRNPTLLNEIYTELNITESESGEISNEHEVRQIERQSRGTTTEETPIKCNDIFKPLPEQDKHIRSVLTKGVAGIGKTVSVQKFILDWSEEKENQDVHLVFPLPFREINLMKDKTLSLLDLLHLFFPETKEMEIFSDEYKVLFIFDGLDECRLSLDFHSSVRLCDVSESTSVDVMLTNLIKGNLFPSARIWITSRPAAADLIPSECVDRVTEVQGFSDPQKEEYFRKRISDESLSDQIISHLKSSRSLYIMCHIPVFCWISVTVLERILSDAKSQEIPKTLTQMYTHFLIIQTNIQHQKDYAKKVKDVDLIFKLCELSYEHLVKGNLIFNEEDLRECGIDVTEGSVDSVLHTQIFRDEFALCQRKVYSFVHLSIQEHLAALYVHLTFINNNINVFEQIKQYQTATRSIHDLYRRAIDEAVQSKNGHLDLFLRFLLGLSLKSNQHLIQILRIQTGKTSHSSAKIVRYIKQKTTSTQSPEKCISLFHCLNELGDPSLLDEIPRYLKSALSKATLSSSQWSALVLVMLTSEQELKKFNMNQFVEENKAKPLKVLQKLLPVICESSTVLLYSCNITDEGCVALTSALRSNPSHLTHLNLSDNNLGDSGVKLLSAVLENPNCKLEILRLSQCNITAEGCVALSSALRSNPSHLKDLNLIKNNLGDSGMEHLSAVLRNPQCKLEILGLCSCNITAEGCVPLTSAMRSNPSHLRELNLTDNNLGDLGMKLISAVLEDLDCKLERLKLRSCNITDDGCVALSSALTSNPSHLRELNLSNNKLGDSGMVHLSDLLKHSLCKLEKLWLINCKITAEGGVALTSALKSNPSHLRELNLSNNKLGDLEMELLSDVLKNPDCKLEILKLSDCNITDEGCVALTSALRSNPSHLTELNFNGNNLGYLVVRMLSDLANDSNYKLKKLSFSDNRR
ncbi:uncharacterized protein [Misgurnus anguillicaudatus]|uniref:uncharacterized protein n=1 Tax=Misgurnus anguillicaudatus TaxID=75329 RepID=UPI003CCF5CD4